MTCSMATQEPSSSCSNTAPYIVAAGQIADSTNGTHAAALKAHKKLTRRVVKAAAKMLQRRPQHHLVDPAAVRHAVLAVLQEQVLPGYCQGRALGSGMSGVVRIAYVPAQQAGAAAELVLDAAATPPDVVDEEDRLHGTSPLQRLEHSPLPGHKRKARKFMCLTAREVLKYGAGPLGNELACAALIQAGYLPECAQCKEVAYPQHVHVQAVESCKQALMGCMWRSDRSSRSEKQWDALDQPGLLIAMDYEELPWDLESYLADWLHALERNPGCHYGKEQALARLLYKTPLGSHTVNIMEALGLAEQAASSVHVFHTQSMLIHTDLKTANFLVKMYTPMEQHEREMSGDAPTHAGPVKHVKVADLGSAVLQAQPLGAPWRYGKGAEFGTPLYMRLERHQRRQGWAPAAVHEDQQLAGAEQGVGAGIEEAPEAGLEEEAQAGEEEGSEAEGEAGDGEGLEDVQAGVGEDVGGCEGGAEQGMGRAIAPNMDVFLGDDLHSVVGVVISIALGCDCEHISDVADCMHLWYILGLKQPSTRALAEALMQKSRHLQQAVAATQADGQALLAYLEELSDQGPAGEVLMEIFYALAHAKLASYDDGKHSELNIPSYKKCTFSVGDLAELFQGIQAQYADLTDPVTQRVMVPLSHNGLLRPESTQVIDLLLRALSDKRSFTSLVKYHPDLWTWLQRIPRDKWPEWLSGSRGRKLRASLRQQQQQWDAQQREAHVLPSQLAEDGAAPGCGSEAAADAASECDTDNGASECESYNGASECGSADQASKCGSEDEVLECGSWAVASERGSEDQDGIADAASNYGSGDEAETQDEEGYGPEDEGSVQGDETLSGDYVVSNGDLEGMLIDPIVNGCDGAADQPSYHSKVLVCHDDKPILLQQDAAVTLLACNTPLPCEPTDKSACMDLLASGSPTSGIRQVASTVLSLRSLGAVPSLDPASFCTTSEAGSVHGSVDCSVDHSEDLAITVPDHTTSSSQAGSTPDSLDLPITVPADLTNSSGVGSIHESARLPVTMLASPRTGTGADSLAVCGDTPRHRQDCEQGAFLDCSTHHLPPCCSDGIILHTRHSDQSIPSDHINQELLHTSAGTTGCSSHDVSPHSHPSGQVSFSGQDNQELLHSSGSTSSTTGCSSGNSSYDGISVTDSSSQGRCSIITPTSEAADAMLEASEPGIPATKKKGWRSMLLPFSKQSSSTAAVVKEQAAPAADVKAPRHTRLFAKLGKNSSDVTRHQPTAASQAPVSKGSKKRGLLTKPTTSGKAHDKGSLPVQEQPSAASPQHATQGLKGLCTRLIEEAQRAGVGLTDMWTQVAHELQHEAQRMGLGVVEMWTQVDRFAYQASQELKGVLVCGAPQQA